MFNELVNKKVGIQFSAGTALAKGYTIDEVIEFVRALPSNLKVKIIAGNQSINEDISTTIFRLKGGGMSDSEIENLVLK